MVIVQADDQHVLSSFKLTGKVAAVTGGARGIGLDVSKAMAEAGADVAIIYGTTSTAHDLAKHIATENNVRCQAFQSDVTDRESIFKTMEEIYQAFGERLDIVIVNAGATLHLDAELQKQKDWESIMKVNLDGAFYTAQAAYKVFVKQSKKFAEEDKRSDEDKKENPGKHWSGNIIITASVSATLVNTPQKQVAYNASKAGVVHMAKSLAVEWVDVCRVNCVSPGFIETDMLDKDDPKGYMPKWMAMVPGKRVGKPHELKGAYVFCASDASSYMTGGNIIIDGGYTLP